MQFNVFSDRRMHNLLVIEDNPSDIELLRYFMRSTPQHVNLIIAGDGVEALRMLRGEEPYKTPLCPCLILLDLNLPRKDGREVLAELKQDPELMHIPVVVLSTSDAVPDVACAYQLHANCYLQKPATAKEYEETIRGIERFWLSLAKLPPAATSFGR
jgi:two-component system, chemotaxis family, response regulator Rcp1